LLIIGCGDVARRALPWLTRRYHVYGIVRAESDKAPLRSLGVTPILADLDRPASLKRIAGIAQLVLHFAPPQASGNRDTRTRHLVAALAARQILPRRISYISTTGVYGDCGGARADETRRPSPRTSRASRRLDAERVLRRFCIRGGVGLTILRAPGIYAADRLPLERLKRATPVLCAEEDVYTNHIHADDLAHAACRALTHGGNCRTFNVSDDSELHMGDYFDFVADAFGLSRPPRISREHMSRGVSAMTMSFMEESRRLANRRMKTELGLSLRYPTVLSGIAAARTDHANGAQ
jgi:nucleoside-diphosphate-sugar epimerase